MFQLTKDLEGLTNYLWNTLTNRVFFWMFSLIDYRPRLRCTSASQRDLSIYLSISYHYINYLINKAEITCCFFITNHLAFIFNLILAKNLLILIFTALYSDQDF